MRSLLLFTVWALVPLPAGAIPTPEDLLGEAEQAGLRSQDVQTRVQSLAEIAVAWADINRAKYEDCVERAEQVARQIEDGMVRALLLRTVAMRVAKADPLRAANLLLEAAQVARGLRFPVERASALREVARAAGVLSLEAADDLVQEALEAARHVDAPVVQAACLRDLAASLVPHNPTLAATIFQAAAAALAQEAPNERELPMARAELAAAWAPLDLQAAKGLVELIADAELKGDAVTRVAEAVAASSPDQALVVAQWVPEGPQRAHAIAVTAAALPPQFAATAAELARSALDMLAHQEGRVADETRTAAASALARSAPQEAAALAHRVVDEDIRAMAISAVAERIGCEDPRRGLELLREVDSPAITEPVAARLIPRLAATDPDEAVALARTLRSRRLRVQAFLGIVACLRDRKQHR